MKSGSWLSIRALCLARDLRGGRREAARSPAERHLRDLEPLRSHGTWEYRAPRHKGVLVRKCVLAAVAAAALAAPSAASAQGLPDGGIGFARTIGPAHMSKGGHQAVLTVRYS